ncbi:ribosomal protein S18 acetylase RimI-like enzyme [Diaminobutyricimonas aerilata]|uniref:Ribosomal protein S18 acetylase RimI-like enzyme n=1 Tax=Diaminobutyricimonas aerilata TaxID=1162967 RepID=A0A2M9CIP8_9MICO|nr:GNAT family N-acetyltransferase [Diaminobutyricimonas aerilata]PJJ71784.1 ribosomal protein S18 acetylase RimI-like enzyme [Diaminobutyricimonas aerilata]
MLVRPAVPRNDDALAERLLAVQHAAYRVEAELIGSNAIPALHEDVRALQSAPLSWLVAVEPAVGAAAGAMAGDVPGEVAGAVAWSVGDDGWDIDRLVVDPAFFRRGVGRALVSAVLERAGDGPVTVMTGRDNAPARALYDSLGFRHLGDVEVEPGVHLARFARR